MARLRKMLGSAQHPTVIALMRLIETQSHRTLAAWALRCAQERYLPLTQDPALAEGIRAVQDWLAGAPLKSVKPALRTAAQVARLVEDPICQAASRAVATACGVIQTPTNALGFTFYGVAARAYSQAGVEASAAVYDALADEEFAALLALLKDAAIPDEQGPVKIDWNC